MIKITTYKQKNNKKTTVNMQINQPDKRRI